MPTTCGFPACKFRSRYRGHEDTRHFYRIPKRPLILRQRWLKAIGRTEETVVSQLRICSAHFKDGEKREGDIPVPDPELDAPLSIALPPKENKATEKRRPKPSQFDLSSSLRFPTNGSSMDSFNDRSRSRLNSMFINNTSVAAAFVNAFKCVAENQQLMPKGSPLFLSTNSQTKPFDSSQDLLNGLFDAHRSVDDENKSRAANGEDVLPLNPPFSRLSSHLDSFDASPESAPLASTLLGFGSTGFGNSSLMRPLVALLDGRDCSVEMALLKDIATVAFCDAQSALEIHERVVNEAVIALAYHSIRLQREDLQKFKCLKAIIRIGTGIEQFDSTAATELGIAICHISSQCIEERADSTLSLILNLYRRTFWSARCAQNNSCPQGIEQLRELASGSKRIRGSRLLIVGFGQVGTAVALRAAVFGFQVSFYDPLLPEGHERSFGFTRYTSLEEAVAEADCISFHCPLNAKTKRFVNMTLMKRMKRSVFIVNINSEQLFVESDLLACLKSGQIGAAAFDSYSFGPSNTFASTLASLPTVICTPKLSWYSDESTKELREAASRQVRQILLGDVKSPGDFQNCINRDALLTLNSTSTSQTSTSFMTPGRPEFPFNSSTYQNLYMMNANLLGQSPMGLYQQQQLINQLAQNNSSLVNGNSSRREPHSTTPREDRPSSSSSSNHNNFSAVHDTNDHRSSSAISTNGQEAEEQKADETDGPSEPKIQKLETEENSGENLPTDQPST